MIGVNSGRWNGADMSKIRVMIADDQAIVAEGLGALLSVEDDIEVIKIVENGQKVLDELERQPVDVILMDIRMPIMNGVECTGEVTRRYPATKVLILTTFDDDEYISKAMGNGASGYMLKDLTAEKLTAAIRNVHIGNTVMHHWITQKILSGVNESKENPGPIRTGDGEVLTSREMDILRRVARGLNNSEISEELYLSLGTVKNYITTLYNKLGIKGRTKLMTFAIDNGQPEDEGGRDDFLAYPPGIAADTDTPNNPTGSIDKGMPGEQGNFKKSQNRLD